MTALRPNPQMRNAIARAVDAETNLCWTCGSCDSECPVNLATSRLHPRKIIRMANLGFLDELLRFPMIWYCITCKRCEQICPNLVKPYALIAYIREEVIRRCQISQEMLWQYRDFISRFQRVRWHAVEQCLQGGLESLSEQVWQEWLNTPVLQLPRMIHQKELNIKTQDFILAAKEADISSCFNCSECSCACPLACERSVFDPQWIFRMANYGLCNELLGSQSIWLCIACGRCSEACSQLVKGHNFIRWVKKSAVEKGFVDEGFGFRLSYAEKLIYCRYLEEIDRIMGFSEKS